MAFLDETGLAEVWNCVKAVDVKAVVGSYAGTGTGGSSNPSSLTFSFKPDIVAIYRKGSSGSYPYFEVVETFIRPFEGGINHGSGSTHDQWANKVSWSNTGVSWYAQGDINSSQAPGVQMNASGETYYYYAIGK